MPVVPTANPQRSPDTRRAWLSLLGFVLSLPLAFLVGEGLASMVHHPLTEEGTAPWWVMVVAGLPAMAVFVLPTLVSWSFGRRAVRVGDVRGRTPVLLGAAVAGLFVAVNVISAVVILVS